MAWETPSQRQDGEVLTVGYWNNGAYRCLRYLKGLEGIVTIESDASIGDIGIGWHNDASTGVHQVSGTDYFALASGSQYTATNRAGDCNLGQDFRREGAGEALNIYGASSGYRGLLRLYGATHGDYPGQIRFYVPNSAGSDYQNAIHISRGANPEFWGDGRIQKQMLKTDTGSASRWGSTSTDTAFAIEMHRYTFMGSLYSNGGTNRILQYYQSSDPGNDIGRARMQILHHDPAYSCCWRWRYCTASGPPEVWIGINDEGKIVAAWESGDPPPQSPPIASADIVKLIKLNPSIDEFSALREGADAEGLALSHKLLKMNDEDLARLLNQFQAKAINTEDVPKIRRVEKTRQCIETALIPKTGDIRVFNEMNGKWENKRVPLYVDYKVKEFNLTQPELGENSPIEEVEVIKQMPLYDEEEILCEENFIEERIISEVE